MPFSFPYRRVCFHFSDKRNQVVVVDSASSTTCSGHTPNVITTYSFLFSLMSRWFLYKDCILLFVLFHHIGYFFDCMDGQMARTYNMVSRLGDVYDHTTDMTVDILLFVVIWYKYKHIIPPWCIGLIFVLFLMFATSMGCQQLNYADSEGNELLDVNIKLCPSPSSIVWTRFFGAGTWQIFLTLLVIFLHVRATTTTTGMDSQNTMGGLPKHDDVTK